MGLSNSRRRARMDHETGESSEAGGSQSRRDEDEPDLATILSYLIRSGQVRIFSQDDPPADDMDDDDDDDEDDEWVAPAAEPKSDPHPDTSGLDMNQLRQEILLKSGQLKQANAGVPLSVTRMIQQREIGLGRQQQFSPGDCCSVGTGYLPNKVEQVACFHHKAFCGTYSQDGDVFLSACQDQNIRVYNTTNDQFKLIKCVRARDVGWSVIDTAFSPDGNYLIYSSWSDYIHLCNLYGDYETHSALPLDPGPNRFCVFSLAFSMDNREILGGASDGDIYVYDRERNERTLRIDAHEDDVNAVAFADGSSQILYSGADDGLVKVWDRRTLTDQNPQPVGTLAGHFDGITFIDSKGDARYLISNSKDQSIKLWDIRKFSAKEGQDATRKEVQKQTWDYRWQQVPKKVTAQRKKLKGDTSLMTYRGHCVLHTLIRCRFSPAFTTGQRYIYTGCATGAIVIYDVLTGKVVSKLNGHRSCARDISWHPYEHHIISSSWDGTVNRWHYSGTKRPYFDDSGDDGDGDDDDGDDCDDCDSDGDKTSGLRRSRRLQQRTGFRRLFRLF